MKKAISVATSAALLASLLATAVAPAAFAAVTVTSAGNVPQGGSSVGTATFKIEEQAAASLATNGPGTIDIQILDFLGAPTLSFSGTPVVSAPGSLGATAAVQIVGGNVLRFSWTNTDIVNIESIQASGLTINDVSVAGAALGAIQATLMNPTGNASVAAFSAGCTASGFLATGVSIGLLSATVNVTTTGCPFVATAGTPGAFAFAAGVAGTSAESLEGTAAPLPAPPAAQQQVLAITTAGGFTSAHNAGDVVTQTGAGTGATLTSPGTVVATLVYSNPVPRLTVYPGENNSPATNLVLTEPSAGFLAAASTFTYTIATDGVVFSTAPTVTDGVVVGITGNTAVSPTVVTTSAPHGFVTGNVVTITGSNSTPTINGSYTVTVISATTFSIPVAVTTAGTAGSVSGPGAMALSAPVLSVDRKSATVTVTTASTIPATITLSGILYDVAATVPPGTLISVGVATSGARTVSPASRSNAIVFRGIVAASATNPTVYIGENGQAAGIISFKEATAGFFTDGTGSNNWFEICPSGVNYVFTLAPYARVTGGVAAGNLILRDGAGASATNLVKGTQDGSCYYWTVWTKSTTASTIEIGNADLTTGPIINVSVAQAPGGVNVDLYIGSSALANNLAATVKFATATYRNQVAVTALSQPKIAVGAVHAAGGNLQIAETGLGQLKAGEDICIEVLWRSGEVQDEFLNSMATADLPIATASGTGLVISPVSASRNRCQDGETNGFTNPAVPAQYMQSFSFEVLQQSTAGDGKLVISNINYTVLAGGSDGPVQLSVWGFGGSPTFVLFHSTVSNAIIGAKAPIAISAVSALGLRPATGYTTRTPKYTTVGKYVTFKFGGGAALVGQRVNVLVAFKVGGVWGPIKYLKSAWADANGIVTFAWKSNSAAWVNVRVQWPGSAAYGVSYSRSLAAVVR